MAVEVRLDGRVSNDPSADLARLGVEEAGGGSLPDRDRIPPWVDDFPRLVQSARDEIDRRAEQRRQQLVELAHELVEDELIALGQWRGEEERRVERLSFGTMSQPTFEDAEEYDRRMRQLEAEYERRRAAIRDRSQIHLGGVELVGGRLIVREAL